jgi:6-phosphofructokinase 1
MGKLRGTLLVGQSGGPTAVINRSLLGVIQEAVEHREIENIYGLVHGIEGALHENMIDLKRERPSTLQGLLHTPSSALGSCRHRLVPHDLERVMKVFRAHDVRYFIYIGGNDSMDTCHKIGKLAAEEGHEMRVMGVPKTVDNDLAITDHCPGYGSAARFIAMATRDAGKDLDAMSTFDDVTILEAMGRNSGWLTAASVLGKRSAEDAPHLVYVPERPFDEERFLEDVKAIHSELGRVFVVVCEGVRDERGEFVGTAVAPLQVDAFGHRLTALTSGVGSYLSGLAAERLGLQARFLRPGLIGRALTGCVSSTDQQEAYLVGKMAVMHAVRGESGYMVTLVREPGPGYRCTTGLARLEEVAAAEKKLPDEYINEEGNFVTEGFREYALPLIGDPLPEHVRLEGFAVPKLVGEPYRG